MWWVRALNDWKTKLMNFKMGKKSEMEIRKEYNN